MTSWQRGARVLALAAALIAAMVALSWLLDLPALRSWFPGQATMKMNASLCLGLLAFSLWMLAPEDVPAGRRRLAMAAAALASVVAAATLAEYLARVDLGIDQLLVSEAPGALHTAYAGRMAVFTTVIILFLSLSLLGLDWEPRPGLRPAQLVGWGALTLPFVSLVACLFQARGLYGAEQFSAISLPAIAGFGLLAVGALATRPRHGSMEMLTSPRPGGAMLRRGIPALVAVTLLLAWLSLEGVRYRLYSFEVDQTYLVVPLVLVFIVMLFFAARSLDRVDRERDRQQQEVEHLNRDLELRVAERTHQLTDEVRERRRLSRTLALVNRCRRAVIEQREEHGLLEVLCRAILDAGYLMAWIGYAEHDARKTVRPVAQAGAEAGYLGTADITWDEDEERGRGPTGTAVRTAHPCLSSDVAADPRMRPWREEAARRGFRSCLALPLNSAGATLGALSIYAAETDAFDAQEVRLLTELADNLAFGLGVLRAEEDRRRALEERSRLAAIVESSDDAIVSNDLDGVIWSWNAGAERLLGYTASEMIGRPATMLVPREVRDHVVDLHTRVYAGETFPPHDCERLHKDGTRIPVWVGVSPVRDSAGRIVGASSLARDIRERKLLELKLRQEQSYFRSLIEASIDALMTTDVHGTITDVNHEMELLTGRSRQELVGTAFSQHCTDPAAAAGGIRKVLEAGRLTDYELVVRHADGRQTPVAYNASTFSDSEYRLQGIFAAARDITARKRMELSLRESEERYRSLVVATSQIVWTTNPAGEVADMPMWRALTGQTVEQVRGSGWLDAVHLHDRGRTAAVWKKALAQRKLYDVEYRVRRADGEYRHLAARGVPVLEVDGAVREWVGTCADITERKQAEESLRESERKLSVRNRIAEICLTMPDDQMYAEVLKVLLETTGSKYGVFGYLDEQGALVEPTMTHTVWEECQVPDKSFVFPREQWGDSIWANAIRQQRVLYSNQPSTKVPAGHVPITRNISLPILHHGEAIGLFQVANKEEDYSVGDIQMMRDIADYIAPVLYARLQRDREEQSRRQAQEEIRELNVGLEERVRERTAELAASNQELESFTYSVSHDLRSPLRHIDGFSRILLDQYGPKLDDQGRHYLERVRQGTQFMGRLVDDLLNLSRVGRQALHMQITSLDTLVQEARSDLAPESSGRQVEWCIQPLPFVDCDPGLMKQVFSNLIANALKFTRPRPQAVIEVGRTERDGRSLIFVRDNGVGFSMKYADKLFGVFQRLHRQEDFEGTGIGLATVRSILRKHGGDIWAESELDHGATFFFTVETAATPAAQEAA